MPGQTLSKKPSVRGSTRLTNNQLISALQDIMDHYQYALTSVPDRKEIAKLLSKVANHTPAWEHRYVLNFMTKKVLAGEEFGDAITKLAAMTDGMPMVVAQGHPVTVTALGTVRPGSLVFGDSQKCAVDGCPVHFIPRVWNQRYCPEHRTKHR